MIAGHGRLLAAEKLSLDEMPVIRIEDLTDAQAAVQTLFGRISPALIVRPGASFHRGYQEAGRREAFPERGRPAQTTRFASACLSQQGEDGVMRGGPWCAGPGDDTYTRSALSSNDSRQDRALPSFDEKPDPTSCPASWNRRSAASSLTTTTSPTASLWIIPHPPTFTAGAVRRFYQRGRTQATYSRTAPAVTRPRKGSLNGKLYEPNTRLILCTLCPKGFDDVQAPSEAGSRPRSFGLLGDPVGDLFTDAYATLVNARDRQRHELSVQIGSAEGQTRTP